MHMFTYRKRREIQDSREGQFDFSYHADISFGFAQHWKLTGGQVEINNIFIIVIIDNIDAWYISRCYEIYNHQRLWISCVCWTMFFDFSLNVSVFDLYISYTNIIQ